MKYKVVIGWRCEFVFNDAMMAMMFLDTAAHHKSEDNNETIRLEVIETEGEEAEDNQDV